MSNNKLIIISGASGYVGKALVKKLTQEGYSLACIVRSTPLEVGTLPQVCFYECDLRLEKATEKVVENIIKNQGAIFGCVHLAASKPVRSDISKVKYDDLQTQLEGTFVTGFNLLQVVGRDLKMKKEGGVLIGVTTVGVAVPLSLKYTGAYGIAKSALQSYLLMLREELQPSSVRVYSVAPGFMDGGMNKDTPRILIEMVKQKSKNGMLATAEDVADKISYLLSCENNIDMTHLVAPEVL